MSSEPLAVSGSIAAKLKTDIKLGMSREQLSNEARKERRDTFGANEFEYPPSRNVSAAALFRGHE